MQFAAQIDNSVDAELLELFYSVILWLRATIEEIVNLPEIRNARHINFLSKCWLAHSRRLIMVPAGCTPDRDSRGK